MHAARRMLLNDEKQGPFAFRRRRRRGLGRRAKAPLRGILSQLAFRHAEILGGSGMRLLAGASGYSFKEWKGDFYPADMRPEGMLAFYSARLPTVEINNTFYRMPKTDMLENWARTTPPAFRFAIKASRRITHFAHLKAESADSVAFLYRSLTSLGEKRGPVLFQLPPVMKKDLARLRD